MVVAARIEDVPAKRLGCKPGVEDEASPLNNSVEPRGAESVTDSNRLAAGAEPAHHL